MAAYEIVKNTLEELRMDGSFSDDVLRQFQEILEEPSEQVTEKILRILRDKHGIS